MKKVLLTGLIAMCAFLSYGQTCSISVSQVSYSNVDPDGGGPALGSVVIRFSLQASVNLIADGMPFSFAFQSSKLMASSTNTTVKIGPLATAPTTWIQNADNRTGNVIGPLVYGGQSFDRRMIVSFVEPGGNPNVNVGTSNTGYVEVTFWTLSATYPHGGYITPEPGAIVPQNELSTDGGLTTYPYLSPNLNSPVPLGQPIVTPVLFTYFNADCNDKGAMLRWETATEENADFYEIQRSADGSNWKVIDKVDAAGNSAIARQYQYLDLEGGNVQYRLRQVDIDGKETYTAIRRTSCEGKSFSSTLYPVPARDKMTLVVRSDRATTTNLQILDMNGRIVKQMRTVINNGNTNIIIDVNSLPQGEYMLMSTDPSVRITKKFTVAR